VSALGRSTPYWGSDSECRMCGGELKGWRDPWHRSLVPTHTALCGVWRYRAFQRKI
jgi:hypothetical protein